MCSSARRNSDSNGRDNPGLPSVTTTSGRCRSTNSGIPSRKWCEDRAWSPYRALPFGSASTGQPAIDAAATYRLTLTAPSPTTSTPRRAGGGLRPLTAPTLVIWGTRDRHLGAELAEPEPRDVPNLARVEYLDASHWVQHDQPEAVNQLLIEFFSA